MSRRNPTSSTPRFRLESVFGNQRGPTHAEVVAERLLESGFWRPRAVKPQSLARLSDYRVTHRTHSRPQS